MKTFKEYLSESKKTYSFKVKIAGELPEDFADRLKARINNRSIIQFEALKTTPVQELPLDFPELKNVEVHIFDVMTEYPLTPQEIEAEITEMNCCAVGTFKVRNSQSPSEIEQIEMGAKKGLSLSLALSPCLCLSLCDSRIAKIGAGCFGTEPGVCG